MVGCPLFLGTSLLLASQIHVALWHVSDSCSRILLIIYLVSAEAFSGSQHAKVTHWGRKLCYYEQSNNGGTLIHFCVEY